MPNPTYQITMRSGPTPGDSYLLEKEQVFLGRDASNEIPIADPEISRRHARFLVRPEGVFLEDLGSTNGTFLNGLRVSVPQVLRAGDVITLGENIVVLFELAKYDADAPVVDAQTHIATPPYEQPQAPQPVHEQPVPETPAYQAPSPPPVAPVPPVYQPVEPAPVYTGQVPEPPKKRKMSTGLLILLIVLIATCVIVSLVLTFMPASWWCALTFNQLPGCPVY